MLKKYFLLFFCMLLAVVVIAQTDTLVLKNKNIIVGELKTMNKGVAIIETDYSEDDFKIKWDGVSKVITTSSFSVTSSDGKRHMGRLYSPSEGTVIIYNQDSIPFRCPLEEIVLLNPVKTSFWENLSASISFGYSLTRAQNLKQLSARSSLGYKTRRWSSMLSFDAIHSTQDDVDPVFRRDGTFTYNYLLPKDWYIPISVTYLSNTEQQIEGRILTKLGLGKFVIHSNKAYWGFSAGANYNYESYFNESSNRKSWEGFIGTELNLFDIGDLSLLTRVVGYPSFTESGRFRSDFTFDMKYDLPFDFFINLGVTINYDNRPVENATTTDYVLQTTFGWKL